MSTKEIPTYKLIPFTPIVLANLDDIKDDFVGEPHRHEFYEILWFKNGGNAHMVDFQPFVSQSDSLFFIPPGKVHQMSLSGNVGHLLIFSQNVMSKLVFPNEDNFFNLFYPLDNIPYICPSGMPLKMLDTLFELMLLESKNSSGSQMILQSYLRTFLLHTQRIVEQREQFSPGKNHERLLQLFLLIETHYKTEKSVSFYANCLTLTPKRVNEIAKARFGKTVTRLIHERLLLEAKRELHFGKYNIKEISYALGFTDPTYFSRFFKKWVGMTPEHFRTKVEQE